MRGCVLHKCPCVCVCMCAKQHFVARITAVERSEQHIYQFVLFVYRACLIHPDILRDYREGRGKKKERKEK